MIKLRCVIEHITFQNSENGWSVMKANVKDYDSLVTLVGLSKAHNIAVKKQTVSDRNTKLKERLL